MATPLNKNIVREIEINGESILVTLTPEKKILFRKKGFKKNVEHSLDELYALLTNSPFDTNSPESKGSIDIINSPSGKKGEDGRFLVNLADVRSQILVSADFDLQTKIKLEKLIAPMIKKLKNKK